MKVVGGLGFEPRLAESESAVLPLDDPPSALPLGVLRTPAGFTTSHFLALDFARIARHETRRAQRPAQGLIVLHECARDAVANGPGLAGDATAAHLDGDVELGQKLYHFQRLAHDHPPGLASEELIERAFVDGNETRAGLQTHPCSGGLA